MIDNGRCKRYKPRLPCDKLNQLDESFPIKQFNRKEFEIRAGRNRDKYEVGFIKFVRKGFIPQRLKKYELQNRECIHLEFTISSKRYIYFIIYRSQTATNIDLFFEEMTNVIDKGSN